MKPNDVNYTNEQKLLDNVYNYKQLETSSSKPVQHFSGVLRKFKRRIAKYKVGDYVRLSKYKLQFEKGYTPNWTAEIFTIRKVLYNTDPITYLLNDYNNRPLEGCIYAEELQPVKHPNVYLIEKELYKRNGRVRVKWLGFGPEHNSWVPESDIV